MADVALNLDTANAKDLAGQGIRAYVLQDYETAVRALSKASELLVAEHGSETHNALGDVYLYYGKALLDLSRKESDPLVDGALKTVEEEDEEEKGGESSGEEQNETEQAEPGTKDESSEANQIDDKEAAQEPEAPDTKEAAKEGEAEEELTDLQVAWEVLELAKRIFKERGDEGTKNLAETLVVLGEISLESGNFPSAIEDMLEGLEMQKSVLKGDSRTVAETLFKLGGAYSTNGQIDEAIASFTSSYESLKNIIASLEKDEEHKADNAEELEELTALIPEIEEKIADMKNLKVELAQKKEEEAEPKKTNGSSDSSSSSKLVNDISHLVKRKRKDDEGQEENPAKRPSP